MSNPQDVRKAGRANARRVFDRCDILVNNAGVYGPMGPVEEVDWARLGAGDGDQRVRLGAAVPGAAAAFQATARYGKIVQLSGGGATNPLPRISAYAASKAAIVRFAETLALEERGRSAST